MSIESIKVRDLNTVSTLHDDDLLLVARNTGTTENIKVSDLLLYVSNSSAGSISIVNWEKTITNENSESLISTYLNTPGLSGISIDSTKSYYFFGMHKSSGLYTSGYFQYNGAKIPVLTGSASLTDAARLARDTPATGTYEAFAFINGGNLYINNNISSLNAYTFYFSFIGI